MTASKKVGIWMNHSFANIMELNTAPVATKTITCEFTRAVKGESIEKSESLMHYKQQHQQQHFYQQLADVMIHYEHVLLFGPTDAKTELLHTVQANHHFDAIKIVVKNADQMTENQQHAFVRDYFGASAF